MDKTEIKTPQLFVPTGADLHTLQEVTWALRQAGRYGLAEEVRELERRMARALPAA